MRAPALATTVNNFLCIGLTPYLTTLLLHRTSDRAFTSSVGADPGTKAYRPTEHTCAPAVAHSYRSADTAASRSSMAVNTSVDHQVLLDTRCGSHPAA